MNFGIEIIGKDKALIDYLINQVLNPNELPPIQLGQQRYVPTPKQKILADIAAGADEGFYVNRTRGEKFNKTYYTTASELLILIGEHINTEEGWGLDLVVANEKLTWVFVTNHDGDIYKMR